MNGHRLILVACTTCDGRAVVADQAGRIVPCDDCRGTGYETTTAEHAQERRRIRDASRR